MSEAIAPDKLVVPKAERSRNRVDFLLEEIREIRANCEHDFRLLSPPTAEPSETKVAGIYCSSSEFLSKCLKCSLKKWVPDYFICRWCLGKMKKESEMHSWEHEKYLNYREWGSMLVISRCINCHIGVAHLEPALK